GSRNAGRKKPHVISAAVGRIATASAICTTTSAVHVAPSRTVTRLLSARSPPLARPLVARKAGTAPAISAAMTTRPATYAIVSNEMLGYIQNGFAPGL